MAEEYTTPAKRTQFAWVKDRAGNEYVCDVGYLKDPKNIQEEELKFQDNSHLMMQLN